MYVMYVYVIRVVISAQAGRPRTWTREKPPVFQYADDGKGARATQEAMEKHFVEIEGPPPPSFVVDFIVGCCRS
jgi:hypothetical protein